MTDTRSDPLAGLEGLRQQWLQESAACADKAHRTQFRETCWASTARRHTLSECAKQLLAFLDHERDQGQRISELEQEVERLRLVAHGPDAASSNGGATAGKD